MGKRKQSQILAILLCLVLVVATFPITANADMGPKASVRIWFENMGDEVCYGTLLSERESTGPASVWDGTEENARTYEENQYGKHLSTIKTQMVITFYRKDGW